MRRCEQTGGRIFPEGRGTVSEGDANPRREASHKGLHGAWVGVV